MLHLCAKNNMKINTNQYFIKNDKLINDDK